MQSSVRCWYCLCSRPCAAAQSGATVPRRAQIKQQPSVILHNKSTKTHTFNTSEAPVRLWRVRACVWDGTGPPPGDSAKEEGPQQKDLCTPHQDYVTYLDQRERTAPDLSASTERPVHARWTWMEQNRVWVEQGGSGVTWICRGWIHVWVFYPESAVHTEGKSRAGLIFWVTFGITSIQSGYERQNLLGRKGLYKKTLKLEYYE